MMDLARCFVQSVGRSLTALLLSGLFLHAVPVNAAIDPSSFAPKADFATNTGPIGVTIGDIDGDHRPDLVVSNSADSVSVLRNTSTTGHLSFDPELDLSTTMEPHGVAIEDIDGDGKPDLVVSIYGAFATGSTVSVLRNTSKSGSVSFAAGVSLPTNQGPVHVATADIDGDGKPDLVVSNFGAGRGATVSVLRNTSSVGSVSFAPKVDLSAQLGPFGLAVRDIDGDSRPDLAVANNGSPSSLGTTVSVWRNTSTSGSVAFDARLDFVTGNGPRHVAIDDVDGDGKPDLAVTNWSYGTGSTVSVLRNTSVSGGVSFDPKLDFATGNGPREVVVGDMDRDGKPDLAMTNLGSYDGTTLSVLRNTSTSGSVSFDPKVDFGTGAGPLGLACGELTDDGWLDLAVANYGTGDGTTVSVLRGIPPLTVIKSAINEGGDPLRPGERITYTIAISNNLDIPATNVVVSDTFPAYTDYVPDSIIISPSTAGGTPGTLETQPVIATDITLTAQSLVTVTYAVTVASPLNNGTVIANTAAATSTEMSHPSTSTVRDIVASFQILAINKTSQDSNGGALVPGDKITYTIVITNTGVENATGGLISDTLPANTTFVPGSISLSPPGAGTPGIAPPVLASNLTIQPNQPISAVFAVIVDSSLSGQAMIVNTASITSTEVPVPISWTVIDTVEGAEGSHVFLPIILKNLGP